MLKKGRALCAPPPNNSYRVKIKNHARVNLEIFIHLKKMLTGSESFLIVCFIVAEKGNGTTVGWMGKVLNIMYSFC